MDSQFDLNSIKAERSAVAANLKDLVATMETDVFLELSATDKVLLTAQKRTMNDYLKVLDKRIKRAEDKLEENK